MNVVSKRNIFYPKASAYAALFRGLILILGAVVVAATVLGQMRKHRFPAYEDLAYSLALPFLAYVLVVLILTVGCRIFSTEVTAEGIRSYNGFGWPMRAKWSQIVECYIVAVSGIPYLFLRIEGCRTDMTVPVWMDDLSSFFAAIEQLAPAEHPIQQFINTMANSHNQEDGQTS